MYDTIIICKDKNQQRKVVDFLKNKYDHDVIYNSHIYQINIKNAGVICSRIIVKKTTNYFETYRGYRTNKLYIDFSLAKNIKNNENSYFIYNMVKLSTDFISIEYVDIDNYLDGFK